MRDFFDTSVLIAAFWKGHPSHAASLNRLAAASPRGSYCALHTLAEVYAVMTSLPVKDQIPPDQALLFVQEVRDRFTTVSLEQKEYYETIALAAERGFTSGRIYDALILRCAAKIKADVIYTWNLKHFRGIDPKLAEKVRTP